MTTVRNQILDILYFGYPLRSWQEEQLLTATSEVDDDSLDALPVTSRSGYPLRQHEWQTRLDRVVRLSKNRIGSLPGMHSLKYRNVKISPHLLSSRVAGYDESIRAGFAAANQTLKLLSIDLDHPALQSFQQSRLGTEQLASLGYLHIPS